MLSKTKQIHFLLIFPLGERCSAWLNKCSRLKQATTAWSKFEFYVITTYYFVLLDNSFYNCSGPTPPHNGGSAWPRHSLQTKGNVLAGYSICFEKLRNFLSSRLVGDSFHYSLPLGCYWVRACVRACAFHPHMHHLIATQSKEKKKSNKEPRA